MKKITAMDSRDKRDYQKEVNKLKGRYSRQGQELIQKAYEYASEAHEGQLRLSGEPYISHCVEVAKILAELEMDYVSIAAGLLHDVIEDTGKSLEQLKEAFPEPIPLLVEGITKISELSLSSARERYVENLRKMLLAMAKDIRVIIIKLSDRLHNMRTLMYLPEEKQLSIARDTLEVYAPLANRLGISRIKSELEDLAMMYLYPEVYREIQRLLALKQAEREAFVQRACEFLRAYLEESGLRAEITGRAKHIYSIYRKMKRKEVNLDGIYDLIALRVITETEEDCWAVLGRIHSLWHPIPGTFDDYISMPKDNLYRSLHTTVVGLDGQPIEIQIRTREMHKIAEFGVAAHWKYKEGVKAKTDTEESLRWLRQLTEWIREVQDPGDFMVALKEEVFADTIFCFTPKGDVIALTKGATPLDFAYKIHTDVGNQCKGAVVNNRMVSLRTELKNGDIVRIITGKDGHPSPDWLDIVRTPTARAKIRHYLRSQMYHTQVERGKEILLKTLKHNNLTLSLEQATQALTKHLKKLSVKSMEQLFAEIGFGTISAQAVVNLLIPKPTKDSLSRVRQRPRRKRLPDIILENVGDDANISVRLARCCLPIQGEEIVGFITLNRGIAIHRKDCRSLKRILTEVKPDSSRLIPARWADGSRSQQRVSLKVVARDRVGLLKDITGVISASNINILASSTKTYPGKKRAVFYFLLLVDTQEQFNRLVASLKTIPGIISSSRVIHNW
ncbi:bifunctional (p)ppGpp synthetase/guanosine-3',5'-bis(diphosphate) 3'-pyrophosphohydrolase [Candidatus Sumerlaeota bacterium]|nr:bifunctional (p)ppGpp synthetase/guanosine-3',5'-bis(diphosphate) 3'-pyrophosphohydrolase [Candidatus Sumerlaeota bacterium]